MSYTVSLQVVSIASILRLTWIKEKRNKIQVVLEEFFITSVIDFGNLVC